jgi:hypothetical protein
LSPSTSLGDFWRHDVVGMGVGLLLAAAVTPVTSWAVAPSLAADEVGPGMADGGEGSGWQQMRLVFVLFTLDPVGVQGP